MPALTYKPVYDDTIARIRRRWSAWSRQRVCALATRNARSLLSIRSGAAISMPGLMTTFINVGLNDELTEGLARRPGFAWTAWDSYRRFLQSWAMSAGIDRDVFDAIMTDFKSRYGVGQKLDFTRGTDARDRLDLQGAGRGAGRGLRSTTPSTR